MRYAAGDTYWRNPDEDPPPLATKVLLLNPGGVAILGHWAPWAIAWAPLPKIPPPLKERIIRGGAILPGREPDLP